MNPETLLTSPVLKASITYLASLVFLSSSVAVSSAPCPDALSTISGVGDNVATSNNTIPKVVNNTLRKP